MTPEEKQRIEDEFIQWFNDILNKRISDSILPITDSYEMELVELARMQTERMQDAIDLGTDLSVVERLNQLEREELKKRHQESQGRA